MNQALSKLKTFALSKNFIKKKNKKTGPTLKKIFSNHISQEGFESRVHKEQQLNNKLTMLKGQNPSLKKQQNIYKWLINI